MSFHIITNTLDRMVDSDAALWLNAFGKQRISGPNGPRSLNLKCFRREPRYRPTSEFHVNLLSTDSKIPRASRPSSGRLARFFLFLQVFISSLPVQGLRNKPAIRVKLSGGKPIATLS